MKKINWNCTVKVKLTDYGKDLYYHQFDHLIDKGIKIERRFPDVDENGFTSFQLWSFMELYGIYIHMAAKNVVKDISFYMNDEDLDDVDERGEGIRINQPQA